MHLPSVGFHHAHGPYVLGAEVNLRGMGKKDDVSTKSKLLDLSGS